MDNLESLFSQLELYVGNNELDDLLDRLSRIRVSSSEVDQLKQRLANLHQKQQDNIKRLDNFKRWLDSKAK